MRCPNCETENPEGAKFCIECGTTLQNRCPSCGFENPPRAEFCAECGASLTIKAKGKKGNN
ncbi:MAG: zinc ribbon domain-containing protein, partial [Deltaproteobacteria bacterium]|nr:zinc ribbon domain-containing protein [Deltaproteobacteria bacterium]